MNNIVVKEEQRGYSIRVDQAHNVVYCKLYGFFDSHFERQYYDDFFGFFHYYMFLNSLCLLTQRFRQFGSKLFITLPGIV